MAWQGSACRRPGAGHRGIAPVQGMEASQREPRADELELGELRGLEVELPAEGLAGVPGERQVAGADIALNSWVMGGRSWEEA